MDMFLSTNKFWSGGAGNCKFMFVKIRETILQVHGRIEAH